MPRVMALPENRNKVDSHGPHSSRRQTRFHKKHIPRTRTCETNEGNHDPPDHVPASGALPVVIPSRNVMAGRICSHLFNATGTKTMTGFGAAHTTTLFPRTLLVFHGGIFAVAHVTILAGLYALVCFAHKNTCLHSFFAFSMCMFFTKSHSSGLASSFLHVVSNRSISCWCFFTIIWRKRLR